MEFDSYWPFETLVRWCEELAADNPGLVSIQELGRSPEGRPIYAVVVTDAATPDAQKECALIVCGRHGHELGTRIAGPALLSWLVGPEAREIRRAQRIVVVPCANPDGCVREEFWAPKDSLSATEEATLGDLLRGETPDVLLDIHSWGDVLDGEAVVMGLTADFGVDMLTYCATAWELAETAAAAGYPVLIHCATASAGYNNFLCEPAYEQFHTLALGAEVNHAFLTPDETAESALCIQRGLLRLGNRTAPGELVHGYPVRTILGNEMTSIRAAGENNAELRESRATLWRLRREFTSLERSLASSSALSVGFAYTGEQADLPFVLVVHFRQGRTIADVRESGVRLTYRLVGNSRVPGARIPLRTMPGKRYKVEVAFE